NDEKEKRMRIIMAVLIVLTAGVADAQVQNGSVLISCAPQGGTCYAPKVSTVIYYGWNGATTSTTGSTSITCTNASFGIDPLSSSTAKFCWYFITPVSLQWTQCAANENVQCAFTGT